jgi:hypothetical protein
LHFKLDVFIIKIGVISMIINYSDKPVLKGEKSIFLAGPTPRSVNVKSWRPDAVKILNSLNFDGIVYVPEREFDDRTFDYDKQVWWEREALYSASVIVFWIPRTLPDMPAFTTNVEFGYWLGKAKEKVLYGRPNEAEKNRYLDWLYQTETNSEPTNNLEDTLKEAVNVLITKAN